MSESKAQLRKEMAMLIERIVSLPEKKDCESILIDTVFHIGRKLNIQITEDYD